MAIFHLLSLIVLNLICTISLNNEKCYRNRHEILLLDFEKGEYRYYKMKHGQGVIDNSKGNMRLIAPNTYVLQSSKVLEELQLSTQINSDNFDTGLTKIHFTANDNYKYELFGSVNGKQFSLDSLVNSDEFQVLNSKLKLNLICKFYENNEKTNVSHDFIGSLDLSLYSSKEITINLELKGYMMSFNPMVDTISFKRNCVIFKSNEKLLNLDKKHYEKLYIEY